LTGLPAWPYIDALEWRDPQAPLRLQALKEGVVALRHPLANLTGNRPVGTPGTISEKKVHYRTLERCKKNHTVLRCSPEVLPFGKSRLAYKLLVETLPVLN
jgi:hypothetical protein